ncbi:MAG: fumarylacetoacetate hydrolase family protein [Christensenella sp.]|nr:fumarylacetoacetate hydrolase family protein [Christensenella sp.]
MKLARVKTQDGIHYAQIQDGEAIVLEGNPFEEVKVSRKRIGSGEYRLLAPSEPKNIVAVGLNYRSHAQELGMEIPKEPLIFSKWATSVLDPGGIIKKPEVCKRLDYEAELAFVVGKQCKSIVPAKAQEYILGYTCLNDVTARDLQQTDGQWARCKGFDTFSPFGPWIETEFDPLHAHVRAILNGNTVQEGYTSDYIFDVYRILAYVSSFMTLYPGDVVTTGTPGGIGPMEPGDQISIVVDGIGELKNMIG